MRWHEHDYGDGPALEHALAADLQHAIGAAMAARGRAVLALAGGRTPLPLYRRLAASGLAARLTLVPSDERCVPYSHPASNFAALREAWRQAAGAVLLPLTPADGDAERAEAFARATLAAIPEPFDVVVLGLGNDAHTASLFPGAPQLAAALAEDAPDALRIDPQPLPAEAPFPRVTLSVARLRRAQVVHLVCQGEAKREALRRAQASADPMRTPLSALLHGAGPPLQIHWSP